MATSPRGCERHPAPQLLQCRPGELALVVKAGPYLQALIGRIVSIVRPAPAGEYLLPDGRVHEAADDLPTWIVEFLGPPAVVLMRDRIHFQRVARYAATPDCALRPLRRLPARPKPYAAPDADRA